jgi:hypothetical protein
MRMAELTPLDEKLGEVLGLAQAAQEALDGFEFLTMAEAASSATGRSSRR